MVAKQVIYEGRVQGVGFRYSVKQIAAGFDVVGAVRNLDDGRVELLAQGEELEVAEFLNAIRESHLAAHIGREDQQPVDAQRGRAGFQIVSE